MNRRWHRLVAERNGTTMLEFAMISPIMIGLLLFISGAALLLWSKGVLQMTAASTARCAAITAPDCTGVNTPSAYATTMLQNWGVSGIVSGVAVSVQSGVSCNNAAGRFSAVTINATGPASLVLSLAGLSLSATACYPSGT